MVIRMVYNNFDSLINMVKSDSAKKKMAVAVAADHHTLEAVIDAAKNGIIDPVLIGDSGKIKEILSEMGESVSEDAIYHETDEVLACEKAVSLVKEGKADFLMKGLVDTKVILKAVVDKEKGLGKGATMSHFGIFEVPSYHKLLVVVDGGMVPYPTLEQKKDIINNAVDTLLSMGYQNPKVGALTCVEKLNPKMPETVEANQLKEMNISGEIPNCIVEGPISFDCATSSEIAEIKGYKSPVAGDADIVLCTDIHSGNILVKCLLTMANAKLAGFIVGAKCPIVLTSRASSAQEKYLSIVVSAAATK